jgi:hypothetical protein
MAEMKTKRNKKSVQKFLKDLENRKRAQDAQVVVKIMKEVTGLKPAMWGEFIIGFGTYHYEYESGRTGEVPLVGFSPRKANLTLYIGKDETLLKKLGKHKTSKACLYINRLEDVDLAVLQKLIKKSFEKGKKKPGAVLN